MTEAAIPFANQQSSGYDELSGASPVAYNVVTELGGALRRRPALSTYGNFSVNSQGISGMHKALDGNLYVVAGTTPQRNLYRVTSVAAVNLSSSPSSDIRGSLRPKFAETEAILAIAGGQDIQKVLLSTSASSRLGGGPPQASHVVANASRLLANDVVTYRNKVSYSSFAAGVDYSGHENWTDPLTAGVFDAASRPDTLVALHENSNEVFAFKSTSLQTFQPDPQDIYVPVISRDIGCGAADSVIRCDNSFAWLDNMRRFVMSDARTTSVLSDPIQGTLRDMGTVDDCFGFRHFDGAVDVLVWVFPTEGVAFAFQKGFGWAQWGGWDPTANAWKALPLTAHCRDPFTGESLVASGGRVCKLELAAQHDLGELVRAYIVTGFQDRGTPMRKHCRGVRITLRRGATLRDVEPTGRLCWRDNLGPWNSGVEVSLGKSAEYETVVRLSSMGTYRNRQWKFEFLGIEPLLLVSVVEDYDVLGA